MWIPTIWAKRWEYQTTWPVSWEIYVQGKKQQLELDMEQQTGSKSGKDYFKVIYCHPAYLTYVEYITREGDGTPLQYSCLENPMDGGAWRVTVPGLTKSEPEVT